MPYFMVNLYEYYVFAYDNCEAYKFLPTSNAFKIKALAIIRSKDYKLKSNWISFRRIATKLAQNICDIMLDLLRQFLGFHCNCITC